jgi:hypothetical protein
VRKVAQPDVREVRTAENANFLSTSDVCVPSLSW